MVKPIVVLTRAGRIVTHEDCKPVLMGLFAAGAHCDWQEQVTRHIGKRKVVISPFKIGDEVVATVMVG